jgi:hypothetical protein
MAFHTIYNIIIVVAVASDMLSLTINKIIYFLFKNTNLYNSKYQPIFNDIQLLYQGFTDTNNDIQLIQYTSITCNDLL